MDDDPGAGVYTPFAKAFLKFVRVITSFRSTRKKDSKKYNKHSAILLQNVEMLFNVIHSDLSLGIERSLTRESQESGRRENYFIVGIIGNTSIIKCAA